jgi:hypothetical protein
MPRRGNQTTVLRSPKPQNPINLKYYFNIEIKKTIDKFSKEWIKIKKEASLFVSKQ